MKKKTEKDNRLAYPVKQREVKYAEPLEYEIESDRKINLTKARAFEFLELETFEGERAVREMQVQYLFDEWASGHFLWHHVLLGVAKLGQKYYRVNGQHTCWMRVNILDKHEPVDANVREVVYKVKDTEQLRSLYSAFDRNAPRTSNHVMGVMLLDTAAARGIKPSYLHKLMAGFRLFAYGQAWRHSEFTSPNELVAMVKDKYPAVFNTVGHFFVENYEKMVELRRASVIGACFATFNKAVQRSIDFWTPVVTGLDMSSEQDPRFQLRRFLQEHAITHYARGRKPVNSEEAYRVCINAWNHWSNGKSITKLLVPSDLTDPRPQPK